MEKCDSAESQVNMKSSVREEITERAKVRITGYDFTRSLAVLGMVLVNFAVVMNAETNGPGWLVWLISLLEGRAAATFVILAGVGLSLLSQKARVEHDFDKIRKNRNILLKRSLFLFVTGLLYTPVWPADILHFYGIYIAVGAFLLASSDRVLIAGMVSFIAIFIVMLMFFNYDAGWNWDTLDYIDFWSVSGMIRHLFFNGFHPVFPWTAFLLAGMWLGRQDVSDPVLRKKILGISIAVVILTEAASYLLTRFFSASVDSAVDAEALQFIFGTQPIPPMPLYMLSAGGAAFSVIILCIMLTQKFVDAGWIKPFVVTGQYALTLYVGHVVIGMGILEAFGLLNKQTLVFSVAGSILFYAAGVIFSILWAKKFKRGPLEWVMRKFT